VFFADKFTVVLNGRPVIDSDRATALGQIRHALHAFSHIDVTVLYCHCDPDSVRDLPDVRDTRSDDNAVDVVARVSMTSHDGRNSTLKLAIARIDTAYLLAQTPMRSPEKILGTHLRVRAQASIAPRRGRIG
jgi:hypothetical protein